MNIEGNKGLVSVIMPVYNGMPNIERAIKSILLQTYERWECIIINDGSTDETMQYINSLKDERFTVHHFETNKGRPYARQKGLDLAQGEYMAMLDADDFYHQEKLDRQIKIMNTNPNIDLLGAGLLSFGDHTSIQRVRGKGDNKLHSFDPSNPYILTHAPSMLRTEKAKAIKYNLNLKLGQDTDFLLKYLKNSTYMISSDVLYYYSEFDSVDTNKIKKSYYYYMKENYRNKYFFKYLFLYILSSTFYPLLGKKRLLKKRGNKPTPIEKKEFEYLYKKIK